MEESKEDILKSIAQGFSELRQSLSEGQRLPEVEKIFDIIKSD